MDMLKSSSPIKQIHIYVELLDWLVVDIYFSE